MRKSGLHKQISSIFDGATVPNQEQPAQSSQRAAEAQPGVSGNRQISPVPQPEKPMPAKPRSEKTQDTAASALPTRRPAPLPKKKFSHETSKSDVSKRVQQAVFGSSSKVTPQQKKMTVLVGILSAIFGVVLYVSLGGVGQNVTLAAQTEDDDPSAVAASASKVTPESWVVPEPVPTELRDATVPNSKPNVANSGSDNHASTEILVRGIVYSETKPSAIINNKVYTIGEMINDVKVVSITRDGVTFETDGKSWTQQVQR